MIRPPICAEAARAGQAGGQGARLLSRGHGGRHAAGAGGGCVRGLSGRGAPAPRGPGARCPKPPKKTTLLKAFEFSLSTSVGSLLNSKMTRLFLNLRRVRATGPSTMTKSSRASISRRLLCVVRKSRNPCTPRAPRAHSCESRRRSTKSCIHCVSTLLSRIRINLARAMYLIDR